MSNVNQRCLVISEQVIRRNWDYISTDEYFDTESCTSVEDFIKKIKLKKVIIGGALLVVQNKLPCSN